MALAAAGCSVSGGQAPADPQPYESDPLMHLSVAGARPAQLISREGNGQGGALTSPTVVIARYVLDEGTDPYVAFTDVIRQAAALGTTMRSFDCSPAAGGQVLPGALGYKEVDGAAMAQVTFTGNVPGEILIGLHPQPGLGAPPPTRAPLGDPDCPPELTAAVTDAS